MKEIMGFTGNWRRHGRNWRRGKGGNVVSILIYNFQKDFLIKQQGHSKPSIPFSGFWGSDVNTELEVCIAESSWSGRAHTHSRGSAALTR